VEHLVFGIAGIPRFAEHIIRHFGVLAILLLVLLQDCGIPTLIPGSLLVLAGGYFVYAGFFGLHQAALSIAIGAFLGANLLFFLARWGGKPLIVKLGRYVGLTERQFDMAAVALDRWGPPMLLVTRVLPGTRAYMTAFAGISGWSYRHFAAWTALFCLIWSYSFILIGQAIAPHWNRVAPRILRFSNLFLQVIVILAIITAFIYGYRYLKSREAAKVIQPEESHLDS